MNADVIVIGGGLSGLCTAIALADKEIDVILIEKQAYPKHKVCGEYVSSEVLPFLKSLAIDPYDLGAQKITKFLLSTLSGNQVNANLSTGGFSISRYAFDAALAEKAKRVGVNFVHDTVLATHFTTNGFEVTTKTGKILRAKLVVGAYGKRSNLDKHFNRKFINKPSPYLAVKAHYQADFRDDLVALHNFQGGYCGLSKVETGHVNACYITDYSSFKKFKSIDDFQKQVLYKNTHLAAFFESAVPVFERPLSIGQIAFADKKLIENHVLMCGDSAGMIHPLCGNGMSMAIQSAQVLSNLISAFLLGKIPSREGLEIAYQKAWNEAFRSRLRTGRILARLFKMTSLSNAMLLVVTTIPGVLNKIIERTHGKPLALS